MKELTGKYVAIVHSIVIMVVLALGPVLEGEQFLIGPVPGVVQILMGTYPQVHMLCRIYHSIMLS